MLMSKANTKANTKPNRRTGDLPKLSMPEAIAALERNRDGESQTRSRRRGRLLASDPPLSMERVNADLS